jgi:putative endonuclease
MYYVYVLKSQVNGDIYVGFTSDLKKRFREHNNGEVKATKGYRPWQLVYYEAYKGKSDATKREKQLKEHKPKSDLLRQIETSLAER